MKIMVAAGGTGGHIFPALSVVMEWKARFSGDDIRWIGTSRSREKELCEANGIPLTIVDVIGMRRAIGFDALRALKSFVTAVSAINGLMRREKPDVLLAFGSYVSAPVIVAARLRGVPYFLHEQNAIPGLVNRIFSGGAQCTFLGFRPAAGWRLRGRTRLVGTPVRAAKETYPADLYPAGLDRKAVTLLVCGGSQGALSMDRLLLEPVKRWLASDVQVVWQTGSAGYAEIQAALGERRGLFVFENIPDLYPYYAIAKLVIGRSGASTISEVAYFGRPCVLIPLPWAAENHQWHNAGLAAAQGWGVRIRQDGSCAEAVDREVRSLLSDGKRYEQMSRNALDHTPAGASGAVVEAIRELAGGRR